MNMSNPTTPSNRPGRTGTFKRGAFLNGIWNCDCEPRLPADKFQTKNGGKNHGRWFYTCQKPQHKRCGFFLWADDAKIREEGAVLSGKRSEPGGNVDANSSAGLRQGQGTPVTPRKQLRIAQPLTPTSKPKPLQTAENAVRTRPHVTPIKKDDDDEFDWSSSADDDLISTAEAFETPRKTPRTPVITSPGKRTTSTSTHADTVSNPDDVFTTPSTSKASSGGLLSPTQTPSRPPPPSSQRFPASDSTSTSSPSLLIQILTLLSTATPPISLPPTTHSSLTTLLNTHSLHLTSALKARDLTRTALASKTAKLETQSQQIAELQARIEGLEGEKETLRSVIQHLKGDLAVNGAKRTRGEGGGGAGVRGTWRGRERGRGPDDGAGSTGVGEERHSEVGRWTRSEV